MTTTWPNFLADVREDLKDTTQASYRWSDKVLLLWTKDAIRDYSSEFPLINEKVELSLSGTSYTLPADYVDAIAVECPEDRYLNRRRAQPGRRYYELAGEPSQYYVTGGTLRVNGSTDNEVLLTYAAIHDVPADVDDSSFEFSVMERDIELIRLFVKAKAVEQFRTKQAIQDRYKLGSGDRQDNPLQPEVRDLMADYRMKLAERVGGGTVLLRRDKS